MRRELLRRLIIGFLVTVFLITGASVALRLALNPNLLRQRIIDTVYERTGRDAGLAQASASLTSGLIVKGFYMLDPAPSDLESIAFDRAVVGLSLWDLLIHRRARVNSIDVHRPHVELILWPDGTTNIGDVIDRLSAINSEEATDEEESGEGESASDSSPSNLDSRITADESQPSNSGLDRIRVRGGSFVINRYGEQQEDDRFLDITELSLSITGLGDNLPCPITVSGSLGVEKQSTFTFRGTLDLASRTLRGTLTVPQLPDSLINALFEFTETFPWRLDDGAIGEMTLNIQTGSDYSPIDIEGDLILDDIQMGVGPVTLALDGGTQVKMSHDRELGRFSLSRLEIENSRSGKDGEFALSGQINPRSGEGFLEMKLSGLGQRNLRGILPTPVGISDPDAWVDADVSIALYDGFARGSVEGFAHADQLGVSVPALLSSTVDLAGLRVEGAYHYDLAAGVFEVTDSKWTLPGLISADEPLVLRSAAEDRLRLTIPPLDWSAAQARLQSPNQREGADLLASLMDRALEQRHSQGDGIPIDLAMPAVRMGGWEWTDIDGTLRLSTAGVELDEVNGHVDGGDFTITSQIQSSRRHGTIVAQQMPYDRLVTLWGATLPGDIDGRLTGEFGGAFNQTRGLEEGVIACTFRDAQVADQWIFEELADYLELDSIRRWSDAFGSIALVRTADSVQLAQVALESNETRVVLSGRSSANDNLEILAEVSVAPAIAARRARDPLFTGATQGDDGWSTIALSLTGTPSRPILRPCNSDQAAALRALGRDETVASLFRTFEIEVPEGLEIAQILPGYNEPNVPDAVPAPPREPPRMEPITQLPPIDIAPPPMQEQPLPRRDTDRPAREETAPTPEPPSAPGGRRGEIDL
jgi:hypothetical protein